MNKKILGWSITIIGILLLLFGILYNRSNFGLPMSAFFILVTPGIIVLIIGIFLLIKGKE
ncbi:MAG: hypothetical protein ABII01_04735 [Candidatus Woesearchaeota archaeon]